MLNSQRFFQSSVDGKRIAMTRSGSCLLVPASTCEGDIRVQCAETCTWILRPLNLQEAPVAGDSRIHHLLKAKNLAIQEHGPFLALIGKRNLRHSKFIGEGWMDWSRPRRRALSPPEEVFVLHWRNRSVLSFFFKVVSRYLLRSITIARKLHQRMFLCSKERKRSLWFLQLSIRRFLYCLTCTEATEMKQKLLLLTASIARKLPSSSTPSKTADSKLLPG